QNVLGVCHAIFLAPRKVVQHEFQGRHIRSLFREIISHNSHIRRAVSHLHNKLTETSLNSSLAIPHPWPIPPTNRNAMNSSVASVFGLLLPSSSVTRSAPAFFLLAAIWLAQQALLRSFSPPGFSAASSCSSALSVMPNSAPCFPRLAARTPT